MFCSFGFFFAYQITSINLVIKSAKSVEIHIRYFRLKICQLTANSNSFTFILEQPCEVIYVTFDCVGFFFFPSQSWDNTMLSNGKHVVQKERPSQYRYTTEGKLWSDSKLKTINRPRWLIEHARAAWDTPFWVTVLSSVL